MASPKDLEMGKPKWILKGSHRYPEKGNSPVKLKGCSGKSGRCITGRCSSLIHKFSQGVKSFPLLISTAFPGWGPLPSLELSGTFPPSSSFGMHSLGFVEQRGLSSPLQVQAAPHPDKPSWGKRCYLPLLVETLEEGPRNVRKSTEKKMGRGRKQWKSEEQTHRKDEAPRWHVGSEWVGEQWAIASSVCLSWLWDPLGFVTALERQGS